MTTKYDPRFLKVLEADKPPEDKPVRLPVLKNSPKQKELLKPVVPKLDLTAAFKIQNKH